MDILKELEKRQIVDIDLSSDKKTIELIECCDYYYKTTLNKKEMERFIVELFMLYGQMEG